MSHTKLHLINLYTTTLSQVCNEQISICAVVVHSVISLVKELTSFTSLLKQNYKLLKGTPNEEPDSDAEVILDSSDELVNIVQVMIRRLSWLVGSISFSLIHVKSEELTHDELKKETADQKMTRLLMESKILSGGIEVRFLSTFAQETKDKLKPIL